MQNLDRRISALESVTTPTDIFIIIRSMVTPGHLDAEIDHIRDNHGNEWTRQAGETESAFTDRAASEAKPGACGFGTLIGTTFEHAHDDNTETS